MIKKFEYIFEIKDKEKNNDDDFAVFADQAVTVFSRKLIDLIINKKNILKIYNIGYERVIKEVNIGKDGKIIGLSDIEIEVGAKKVEVAKKEKKEVLSVFAEIDILEKLEKVNGKIKRNKSLIEMQAERSELKMNENKKGIRR